MSDSGYVSLSAQVALERRMDTLADNVANVNTPGFRATRIRFEETLQDTGNLKASFVRGAGSHLDTKQGAFIDTGNPLDFAIRGEGWFAIETDAGKALTRDGRFTIDPEGRLNTINGDAVLDPGGAAIRIDGRGGEITANADGMLYQDGRLIASIGIFEYEPGLTVDRTAGSAIIPDGEPQPIVDRIDVGVEQGRLEQSNVDAVVEMTNLVKLQRTFDAVASLVRKDDEKTADAVKFLGNR